TFIEHQIDDLQHRAQTLRQLGWGRHLVGNGGIPNLCLGAHDALRNGGCGDEEGAGYLFGGQVADLPQRQGSTGLGSQTGMAAGEQLTQTIVVDAPPGSCSDRIILPTESGSELLGDVIQRGIVTGAPADLVDRLEAAGRYQPGPRV